MAFKSSKGRDTGKELKVFRGSSSGQGIGGGGVAAPTDIQASGGATTEPGNGFKYHVFLTGAPGSFEVESGSGTIGVLCVAGGGGGGATNFVSGANAAGAGGGAGGVIFKEGPVSGPITFNCTVSAGGDGATSNNPGGNAQNSVFGSSPQPVHIDVGGG